MQQIRLQQLIDAFPQNIIFGKFVSNLIASKWYYRKNTIISREFILNSIAITILASNKLWLLISGHYQPILVLQMIGDHINCRNHLSVNIQLSQSIASDYYTRQRVPYVDHILKPGENHNCS